jgi:hypothetical protein
MRGARFFPLSRCSHVGLPPLAGVRRVQVPITSDQTIGIASLGPKTR